MKKWDTLSLSNGCAELRYKSFFAILFLLFFLLFSPPLSAYERIVSLKPNLTEILFALGEGPKVVGVTTYCDYPPEAKKIDKVADYLQPDLERLMAKNPDLIVTSKENSSRREIEFLVHKGFRVLTFESDNLDQLKKTVFGLGEALGKSAEAKKIVDQMETTLHQVREKVKKSKIQNPKSKIPRALFVVGHSPLVVAGSGNLFDDMARALGLVNVAGASRLRYPTYSVEQLLTEAPDLVLDFAMGSEAGESYRQGLRRWWSRYPSIPAVREGRVYFLDVGMIRATPRFPGELERLAGLIYGPFSSL